MPILPRYLFRLYLPAFLLCVVVCTGILLMNQFMRLFSMAVMKGISPLWILSCFARLLPYFLGLALPMAFLVALLLTLGTLSERGEVMALRSSGFSFPEILWPFFAFATALSVLLFYLNHKASPDGFHAFRNSYENALSRLTRLDVEARSFAQIGEWKLYPQSVDPKTGRLGDVYLVKFRGPHNGLRIEAPEGRVALERGKGIRLSLYRGAIRMPETQPSRLLTGSFQTYEVFIPLVPAGGVIRDPDLQELSTSRLREKLRDPGTDHYHHMEYTTEAALRSAGAFTPFVFFWIGCPLGLRLEKHAKATGFALSLLILFLFYGLLAVGIGLGRRHLGLSPLAPWLPIAMGAVLGGTLWKKRLRA